MTIHDFLAPLRSVGRTWSFLYAQERYRVLWGLGAAATGTYVAAAAWLSKRVVDSLVASPTDGGGVAQALAFAWMYGAVTLGHAFIGAYYTQRMLGIRDRVHAAADRLLMDKVASTSDVAGFDEPERIDAVRLASAGARALPSCVAGTVEAMQHVVTLTGVSVILGLYHPVLVPLVLLPAVPLFYSQMRVSAGTYAALANTSPVYRRMGYFLELMLGVAAAKEVRIFRSSPFFLSAYERAADEIFAVSRDRRLRAGAGMLGWGTLAAVGVGTAYIYIAALASRGVLTIGDVVMYSGAVFHSGAAIRGLIQSASALMRSALEVGAFFDYLAIDSSDKVSRPLRCDALPDPADCCDWQLRNVTFIYAGETRPALQQLNLEISKGEKVAIVGLNGAGKSTLLKLMLRLIEPTDGQISFRGTSLKDWDVRALRRQCAVVFQDFVKFRLTLQESIALGISGRYADDERESVLKAAAWAGLQSVAQRSPHGYDVMLGKEFGDGLELSEGLWHRVALARAFVRDAAVLFLDEPTASLDARTEQKLFERVLSCSADKTTVIISHRLGITPMVDRVIVLDGGRVVEQGHHRKLMSQDGAYARMYRTQVGMYWPTATTACEDTARARLEPEQLLDRA